MEKTENGRYTLKVQETAEIGAEKIIREKGFYGPNAYGLDPKTIQEFQALAPYRPVLAALIAWAGIFVLVKTYLYLGNPWLYPLFSLFIAGRAGVFLQLAHEAGHNLISKNWFNNWFGDWIACHPIGLDLRSYAEPHVRHHACVNRVCDPLSDSEKYRICDIRNPKLWLLFLKDISAVTAIMIRFQYQQPDANKKEIEEYIENNDGTYAAFRPSKGSTVPRTLFNYAKIALVQALIWAAVFSFSVKYYLLLWLLPLMTSHMFLQRIRGIAEHGLGIQMGVAGLTEKNRGTLYTRSFGTPVAHYAVPLINWIERWLIGSLNVYYHHEHHVFPKVPYYNLPKLHARIWKDEQKNNRFIFAKGYFDCLFFNLRHA